MEERLILELGIGFDFYSLVLEAWDLVESSFCMRVMKWHRIPFSLT